MSPTPSAQDVAPIVVTKRLEKAASKLAEIAVEREMTEEEAKIEDELLQDPDGKVLTDVPTETPTETPTEDDSVGDRVALIFGKRTASSAPENPSKVKSPKTVTNAIVPGSAEDDFEAVPEIPKPESSDKSSSETDGPKPPAEVTPPGGAQNDPPFGPHNKAAEDAMEVDDAWGPGQDNDEPDDRPEAFPDVGFPDELPTYPDQPDFHYRYRVPGSTPQARRQDFERSVRLRSCQRDRYTGRISDEDYRQREHDEMKVALGYVFTFDIPFYFSGPYTLPFG